MAPSVKYLQVGFLCLGIGFTQLAFAFGPTTTELDDIFSVKLMAYQQEDDGGKAGNPNLDEDATVYEGVVLLKTHISDTDVITLQGLWDQVSAASFDDAKNQAETVSGATGYNPGRWAIDLGWQHQFSTVDLSLNAGYGQEYFYRAFNAGLGLSTSLAEGSTQLGFGFQGFNDQVRVIRWDGTREAKAHRRTNTVNFELTQILTPISNMNVSWAHTRQSGFLATSFNSVLVDGNREYETVPDGRRRDALSIRYKQALDKNSVQLGYSYYWDDWGISSSTYDLRYYFRPNENIQLEPNYRFYTQSAADFFATTFVETQALMSSDSDLGDYDGHSTGLQIYFFNNKLLGYERITFDIGLNYYQRSDDLDYYWLTFGASFPL